ncbi:reverse transcriptase domain-containing protein [Tanacetum coccineum]
MANGINNVASKNRRCRTFNFHMDELCHGKVTISIQWDHRKTMSQENPSSPINCSRNVEIPSSGWNTHAAEQQDYPTRVHDGLRTGSTAFREEGRKKLCDLLRRNLDMFAWKPPDMTGVPRHIAEHRLNVREGCPPARQKKRSQAPERNKVIQEEVERLMEAGIIKEVHYHSWLSNPIMDGIRNVLGIQGKHQGDKGMSEQGVRSKPTIPKMSKRHTKAKWKVSKSKQMPIQVSREVITILQNFKKVHKEDRFSMDYKSGSCIQANEEANSRAAYANRTYGKEITHCISGSGKRSRKPRTSAKGQILADFIVERPEEDPLTTPMEVEKGLPDPWTLFTDGSSCVDGSGASLILTNPEETKFTYALRFKFDATNNEAVYEALITGLRIAEQMGVKNLQINVDSRLVSNQVNGSYIAKEPGMIQYLVKVKTLASSFKKFSIKQVLVEELNEKSINEAEVLAVMEEEGDTWMTLIYECLTEETLPVKKEKAKAVRRKSRRYAVINGVLYKKSYLGPLLRCIRPLQANYVLREIHEGSCSMHARTRSVVAKAIRTGYYWPTMHVDVRKMIQNVKISREHGRMILESVKHGPLIWPTIEENGMTRTKKYVELSAIEKTQADSNLKATNIILQGLPSDIYSLVNHHRVSKDPWERIQLLMQGTSLTKKERECKLYDAFDKFSHIKGESLYQYYLRFTQLINDMNIYTMKFEQFQVNTKFLNSLPPEWSNLRPNSYAASTLGTRANTSGTRGNNSGQQRVVKCFNCQGKGHMARQYPKLKRKRDAIWFRDKVLLVKEQGNGKVLNEEEFEFLAYPGIVEGPVT